jgi:hypothetical protein
MSNRLIHTITRLFRLYGLLFVFFITGCNLLFEPEAISVSKIENYDQLVDATDGVYGQFCEAVNSVDLFALNFNADDCYFNPLGNPYRSYYGDL